ncbi:hypothetical protein LCGC14_1479130 [marine sediment metagenome]|uniref:Uncharacterized protein n=1 Tax=marine sediment metagenome TaxID=412755 RepID=A0A0F9LQF7_9ZZZZ
MNENDPLKLEQDIHDLLCDGRGQPRRRELLLEIAQDEQARALLEEMLLHQDAARAAYGYEYADPKIAQSLGRLTDKLAGEEKPADTAGDDSEHPPRAASAKGLSRWTVGILMAAAMLVGAIGWRVFAPDKGAPPMGGHGPDVASIRHTPADVARQIQVFRSISEVFEGRTTWVALANGDSDLGLAGAPVGEQRLLLVRLVLSRGGKVVSSTDLVIVPGQDATLAVPLADGRHLRYHVAAHGQPAGGVSILAAVQGADDAGGTIAALATNVDPGANGSDGAGRRVTVSGAYELVVASTEAPPREVN